MTYTCNFECDHCFLYCSSDSSGTFTLKQLRVVFSEIKKLETVTMVYFEGGEPFLYYPLMVEGIRMAHEQGLETGVVTNSYWATSEEDAELWLKPLVELAVSDLSISDDVFHHGEEVENPAKKALAALKRLKGHGGSICIEKPSIKMQAVEDQEKGKPVIEGGALLKGRAAEMLVEGLPTRHWEEFTECPHEELENPERVHVDSFGNVHLCQGISIGNMWKTPLSELVKNYRASSHPVCSYLVKGGPALLAKAYGVEHGEYYVDECHFCYKTRLALLDRFPEYLAPRQVYGLDQ
ncbi:MAG: radical SAM protein [Candidatus Odinarchaeota archaeon]